MMNKETKTASEIAAIIGNRQAEKILAGSTAKINPIAAERWLKIQIIKAVTGRKVAASELRSEWRSRELWAELRKICQPTPEKGGLAYLRLVAYRLGLR